MSFFLDDEKEFIKLQKMGTPEGPRSALLNVSCGELERFGGTVCDQEFLLVKHHSFDETVRFLYRF